MLTQRSNGQLHRALNVGKGSNKPQDQGRDYLPHSGFLPAVISSSPDPGRRLLLSPLYMEGHSTKDLIHWLQYPAFPSTPRHSIRKVAPSRLHQSGCTEKQNIGDAC